MKKLLTLATALLLTLAVNAQEVYNSSGRRTPARPQQKTGFDPSRIIFGGGVALGFGSGFLNLGASPVVGYRITDRFATGIGVGYLYYRIKEYSQVYNPAIGGYQTYPLKSSLLYPSVWARYLLFDNIFVHAEFENDFQTYKYTDYDSDPSSPTVNQPVQYTEKINTQALLLGAGFRQPVSSNTSFVAMILYDVLQQEMSPYKGRVDFRVGINVGF